MTRVATGRGDDGATPRDPALVGYVGLGNMGGALAMKLQQGVPLLVFDAAPTAAEALVEAGAHAAATLAEVAARCDVIFLCLPTSAHVRAVIFGSEGLAGALRPGTLLIDQSTGDPVETRAMASTLSQTGVDLIDAPVSGGRAGAAAGTIAIMVGASEPLFERALPFLRAISGNIVRAGEVGSGHVIKLVNNLLSTVQRALSFEAITLAAKCGVDPVIGTAILEKGGGRNAYLEQMMGPRILKGKLNVGFTLALAYKDLNLACQMGDQAAVPTPFGKLARDLYRSSIEAMGGDAQVDTIGIMSDRMAGTQVVPSVNDLQPAGTDSTLQG